MDFKVRTPPKEKYITWFKKTNTFISHFTCDSVISVQLNCWILVGFMQIRSCYENVSFFSHTWSLESLIWAVKDLSWPGNPLLLQPKCFLQHFLCQTAHHLWLEKLEKNEFSNFLRQKQNGPKNKLSPISAKMQSWHLANFHLLAIGRAYISYISYIHTHM